MVNQLNDQSILLIGSKGQLGQELQQTLAPYGDMIAVARPDVDLAQPNSLRQLIREVQPQVVINAAAYTAVDKAESEPQLAKAVNAIAPGILAQETEKLGAFLIHFSTDYVFNGSKAVPTRKQTKLSP
jgi:dTDP-4-dehydrorhamnose reductase